MIITDILEAPYKNSITLTLLLPKEEYYPQSVSVFCQYSLRWNVILYHCQILIIFLSLISKLRDYAVKIGSMYLLNLWYYKCVNYLG